MTIQLNNFQKELQESKIDCAFIDDPNHIAYFTHFKSDPQERVLSLIVYEDKAFLLTPALEAEDAKSVTDLPVYSYEDHQDPWKIIKEEIIAPNTPVNTLGIDGNSLIVNRYYSLQTIFEDPMVKSVTKTIQNLMVIKDDEEIERMKVAGRLADKAVEVGIHSLKEGVSELEVVSAIEFEMKKLGITEMSFPTMVLFGDHAGSPHGTSGHRKLKYNELVLFDLGVVKDGYTSDMTRTVLFGETSEEYQDIYDIVLKAQREAQNAIKPGVTAKYLDNIARNIITEAGYGKYFNHRLGHGLGKSVHEFPSVSSANDIEIKEGMCFSIEPGIYIPGKIGVRIEDCVYVTADGSKPFTSSPKTLQKIRN